MRSVRLGACERPVGRVDHCGGARGQAAISSIRLAIQDARVSMRLRFRRCIDFRRLTIVRAVGRGDVSCTLGGRHDFSRCMHVLRSFPGDCGRLREILMSARTAFMRVCVTP